MTGKGTLNLAKILNDATQDGFENLIAQLGTERDKRNASTFVNNKILSHDGNQAELNAMYRTDWVSGKVVDIIPDDMTREWREFTGDIDPEIVKQLIEEENRLGLSAMFNQAHKWGRLYGTGFIVMSINDGNTPDMPLEIDKIKPGGLKFMHAIDRHRVANHETVPIQDPLNRNFGMPEWYRFNETTVKIHHSRMLRFDGVMLPFDEFRRNNYWADSVLDRLYEALTNFNTVTHSAASMVYETNTDIVKVDGLMNYLQTAEGESALRKRFTLAKMLKSFNNMLLLDQKEDFETKTNTFAGLPELIDRYGNHLAGASDIPSTRMFGDSASGLNSTGDGDLKNYYDNVGAQQIIKYKPKLDYFDQIMAKSMGLPDDADLSYTFRPLFQMTPKEIADTNLVDAQRDAIYLDRDVVTEAIVAKDLRQNGTYTNLDDDHIELLEEEPDDFSTDPNNLEIEPGAEDEEKPEGEDEEGPTGEGTQST